MQTLIDDKGQKRLVLKTKEKFHREVIRVETSAHYFKVPIAEHDRIKKKIMQIKKAPAGLLPDAIKKAKEDRQAKVEKILEDWIAQRLRKVRDYRVTKGDYEESINLIMEELLKDWKETDKDK